MFKLTPITGGAIAQEYIGKEGMPTSSRRLTVLVAKREPKEQQ